MLLSNSFVLFLLNSGWLILFLLVIMAALFELGWRLGDSFVDNQSNGKDGGSDTLLAAIFGLLALLLAITLSGASDRFDNRRDLITKELNTTQTAYQSVDLLTIRTQQPIREQFKLYLDSRIDVYKDSQLMLAIEREKKFRAHDAIGDELWRMAVSAVNATPYPDKFVAAQILPELSNMFDAATNQRLSLKFHPPNIIWQALLCLTFVGALVAGYNLGAEKKRDWFLTSIFIVLMSGTIYIILSLEFPFFGLINLHDFEIELKIFRNTL